RRALFLDDADIRHDQHLKDLVFLAPDRPDLIFGPASPIAGADLFLGDMLKGPFMRLEIGSEHVDRLSFLIALRKFVSIYHCAAIRSSNRSVSSLNGW